MEISIEELNELSDRTAAMKVRITELEREVDKKAAESARKSEEIVRLRAELEEARNVSAANYVENIYLRNLLILSGERIRSFVSHLKNVEKWAFLRTFVECCLPDRHRAEQQQLMNEVMSLPDESSPQVLMQNPTINGPVYDVHDNDDVKLSE